MIRPHDRHSLTKTIFICVYHPVLSLDANLEDHPHFPSFFIQGDQGRKQAVSQISHPLYRSSNTIIDPKIFPDIKLTMHPNSQCKCKPPPRLPPPYMSQPRSDVAVFICTGTANGTLRYYASPYRTVRHANLQPDCSNA